MPRCPKKKENEVNDSVSQDTTLNKRGRKKSTTEVKAEKEKKKEEQSKDTSLLDSIYGDLVDMTETEDQFFPSGSLVIDSVLSNGAGIPLGKFISLNSPSGLGKTTLCLHIARNCCAKGFRCLYIDTECGLNRSQLESFSLLQFVENRTFIPKHIRTYRELDDLFSKAMTDESLKFIFLDSLTDIIPDQFIESNISDVNQPGLDARAQGIFFRKYKYVLTNSGVTVFFILQNRTKIAMNYGERSSVQAAGGQAVAYAMDISIELSKKEYLYRSVKGHDKPIPYGVECFLKATKNRYVPPHIPMVVQILFGKGVSNSGAIANALILNGLAKFASRKYTIEYNGETKEFLGKPKFEEFIKSHLDYYKRIIEGCGGIKLLPDSELSAPSDVLENNTDSDDNVDDKDIIDVIEDD